MVELNSIILTSIAALLLFINNSLNNGGGQKTSSQPMRTTTLRNGLPPQGECGVQAFKPSVDPSLQGAKIIDGDPTVENSWPWMVSI